jgi:homoserine O-acetyltransferase/O-succinyltransferase
MTPLQDAAAPQAAAVLPVDEESQEGLLRLDDDLMLHFGGSLAGVEVAWRVTGASGAPIVAALGGISAGRYVTGSAQNKGWWSEIVGPGCALDTSKFRVLGLDFLGGSGATTGPRAGQTDFPSISAYDQAELLRRIVAHLGISQLHAIVGASYGGMVALAFAERCPKLSSTILVISAADRSHPMSTAWRSVQRAMVRYSLSLNDGAEGLRLARALAMATYRSPGEFAARFRGAPIKVEGRYSFPVEQYLLARGDAYAGSYLPEAFVCLSESIDLHQVNASNISIPVTLVAVCEDQLVPLQDMRLLRERLAGPVELFEISSIYGHDAFLKESQTLRSIFSQALNQPSRST